MNIEIATHEISLVVTRFEIDPDQFEEETGVSFEEASTEEVYNFAIGQPESYEVVEDSPEEVVKYLGHEIV